MFVLNTKDDILKKVRNQVFWGTIDFNGIFVPTMEVNGAPKHLITNFLQNIVLCVQNKHIQTGLDLLEDE